MQLRRLCVALHPALVAILAVALLTGGSLASAAPRNPDGCRRASGTGSVVPLSVIPPNVSAQPVQPSIRALRAES